MTPLAVPTPARRRSRLVGIDEHREAVADLPPHRLDHPDVIAWVVGVKAELHCPEPFVQDASAVVDAAFQLADFASGLTLHRPIYGT